MATLTDAEIAFYTQALGNPQGLSRSDLRYAYFLAGLAGALPAPTNIPWANIAGSAAGVANALKAAINAIIAALKA